MGEGGGGRGDLGGGRGEGGGGIWEGGGGRGEGGFGRGEGGGGRGDLGGGRGEGGFGRGEGGGGIWEGGGGHPSVHVVHIPGSATVKGVDIKGLQLDPHISRLYNIIFCLLASQHSCHVITFCPESPLRS